MSTEFVTASHNSTSSYKIECVGPWGFQQLMADRFLQKEIPIWRSLPLSAFSRLVSLVLLLFCYTIKQKIWGIRKKLLIFSWYPDQIFFPFKCGTRDQGWCVCVYCEWLPVFSVIDEVCRESNWEALLITCRGAIHRCDNHNWWLFCTHTDYFCGPWTNMRGIKVCYCLPAPNK